MFGLGKKSNPGGPGSSGLMPSLWVAQAQANFAGDQRSNSESSACFPEYWAPKEDK